MESASPCMQLPLIQILGEINGPLLSCAYEITRPDPKVFLYFDISKRGISSFGLNQALELLWVI